MHRYRIFNDNEEFVKWQKDNSNIRIISVEPLVHPIIYNVAIFVFYTAPN